MASQATEQAGAGAPESKVSYAKLVTVGVLHGGQFFPAAFTGIALPAIFRQEGLDLEAFWLIMAVPRIPAALKWLLAIVVDNHGSARIGYRKSWIIPCAALGAGLYLSLALFPPSLTTLYTIVGIVLVKNFVMAAYDISADGYAAESMTDRERGTGTSIVIFLAFVGGVTGAALMSGVETFGWSTMMVAASVLLLGAAAPAVLRREPPPPEDSRKRRERGESASLLKAVRRRDYRFVMPFVFAFGFATSFQGALTSAFLVDRGLSLTLIGTVLPLATLIGMGAVSLATPILIARLGLRRTAGLGICTLPISALLYYYIATADELPGFGALLAVFVSIAVCTHVWELCVHNSRFRWASESQAGTDYSLQSSLWNLGILCAGIAVGFVAGALGWTVFLVGGVVLSFATASVYFAMFDRVEAWAQERERIERVALER